MNKTLFIAVLCFVAVAAKAQDNWTSSSKKAIKYLESGLQNFNLRYYDKAAEDLLQAIKTDKEFVEAYFVLGDLFAETEKFDQAIDCYKKGINLNPDFYKLALYNLAELELKQGLYKDALGHYQEFLDKEPTKEMHIKKTTLGIQNCEFALDAMKNPVPFNPVNLGENINTKYDEYWPNLTADENILVFTSLIPIDTANPEAYLNRQEDFFISKKINGQWSPAKNMGEPINTAENEGTQSLSTDGTTMYFTACGRDDGRGMCDLYFSRNNNGKWSKPINLGSPVNTGKSEYQPSISSDGNTLYFASNRGGGKGGLDIWKTTKKEDGTWSYPENLGDSINTEFDEMSPFIHPDNETFYFASNGHIGMGGYDIFRSKKLIDGTFSYPKNLGYPVNTNHDETGIFVNAKGNKAYYSSDRMGNMGKDIYEFEIPEEIRPNQVSYFKGFVYDINTKARLEAEFELIDVETDKLINKSRSNQETGEFFVTIPTNHNLALNVSKPGYLFFSENFALKKIHDHVNPFLMDVPLSPIEKGKSVILKNIFFVTNSYKLTNESKTELNKLIEFINNNPSIIIEISGHTDNTGTTEYNQKLSYQRAKSVIDYLKNAGINESRLEYKGYGESKPIAPNTTEENKALNRRTEFTIIQVKN